MTGLVAVARGTRLTFRTEMNQDFPETNEVRDMMLNPDTVVTHSILNVLPAWFLEMAAAVVKNIAIFG